MNPSPQQNLPTIPLIKRRLGKITVQRQIVAMQNALFDCVVDSSTDEKGRAIVTPREKAQCAQAWGALAERLRIAKNIPAPGQWRPEPPPKSRRRPKATISGLPGQDHPPAGAD